MTKKNGEERGMSIQALTAVSLLLVCSTPSLAGMRASGLHGDPPDRCQTWATDKKAVVGENELAELKRCADALRADVLFVSGLGEDSSFGRGRWNVLFSDVQEQRTTERGVRKKSRAAFALEAHGAYELIHRLAKRGADKWRARPGERETDVVVGDRDKPADPGVLGHLNRSLAELRREVHALMDDVNVRRPFAAVLEPSVTVKSSGSDQGTQLQSATLIKFESRRLPLLAQDSTGGLTLGVGGRIGYRPVHTMVEAQMPEATPPPPPTSTLKTAFTWDVGPAINQRLGKWIEVGIFARAGQTALAENNTITKGEGADAILSLPVDEAGDKWKWFFDGGLRIAVNPRPSGKLEETRLAPAFEVVFGHRTDNRFKDQAGLAGPYTLAAGSTGGGFVEPQRRKFFRFAMNQLTVVKGLENFSLSFAVEHEWQRGGQAMGLPPVTTVYLAGTLNLLTALGGKEPKEEKKPESTETGGEDTEEPAAAKEPGTKEAKEDGAGAGEGKPHEEGKDEKGQKGSY